MLRYDGCKSACGGYISDTYFGVADSVFSDIILCINIQNVHKMAQKMAKSTFLFTFSDKKFGGMGILMYFCTRFRIRERIECDNL